MVVRKGETADLSPAELRDPFLAAHFRPLDPQAAKAAEKRAARDRETEGLRLRLDGMGARYDASAGADELKKKLAEASAPSAKA